MPAQRRHALVWRLVVVAAAFIRLLARARARACRPVAGGRGSFAASLLGLQSPPPPQPSTPRFDGGGLVVSLVGRDRLLHFPSAPLLSWFTGSGVLCNAGGSPRPLMQPYVSS